MLAGLLLTLVTTVAGSPLQARQGTGTVITFPDPSITFDTCDPGCTDALNGITGPCGSTAAMCTAFCSTAPTAFSMLTACQGCLPGTAASPDAVTVVTDWVMALGSTDPCTLTTTPVFAECDPGCSTAISSLVTECGSTPMACPGICTSNPSAIDTLKTCNTCVTAAGTGANADAVAEVGAWVTALGPDACPSSSTDCTSDCATIEDELLSSCGGSDALSCAAMCDPAKLTAITTCQTCLQAAGTALAERLTALNDAQAQANAWCGSQVCLTAFKNINECTGDCKTLCESPMHDELEECKSSLPSGLSADQSQGATDAINGDQTLYCKTTCSTECDGIQQTYVDKCGGIDGVLCKDMCTSDNLAEYEKCQTCAKGPDTSLSEEQVKVIEDSFKAVSQWCNEPDETKTTTGNPTVIVVKEGTVTTIIGGTTTTATVKTGGTGPTGTIKGTTGATTKGSAASPSVSRSTASTSAKPKSAAERVTVAEWLATLGLVVLAAL